jgi:hypothetical protein
MRTGARRFDLPLLKFKRVTHQSNVHLLAGCFSRPEKEDYLCCPVLYARRRSIESPLLFVYLKLSVDPNRNPNPNHHGCSVLITADPFRLRPIRLEPPHQALAQAVRVGHGARQPRLPFILARIVVVKNKDAARGRVSRQPLAPPPPDAGRPGLEGVRAIRTAGVVAVKAQVDAPVAARVWVRNQGWVAARLQGAPVALVVVVVVVAALRGSRLGIRVGDVDAAEAEAAALEDGVRIAAPVCLLG